MLDQVPQSPVLRQIFKVFDVLVLAVLLWLPSASDTAILGKPMAGLASSVRVSDLLAYISVLVLWHTSLLAAGLYSSVRARPFVGRIVRLTTCVLLGSLAMHTVAAIVFPHVSELWTPRTLGLASLVVFGSRFVMPPVINYLEGRGGNRRNVLIIGTNQRALAYAQTLRHRPELGINVVGFADQAWSGSSIVETAGFHIACTLDALPEFVRKNVVDEVTICLPLKSQYNRALEVAAKCAEQGIVTKILSDLFDLGAHVTTREFVGGAPLVMIAPAPRLCGVDASWKRIFDFAGSLFLLILFWPLFAVVALAISLTSPGPVFFKQSRLGLNKRPFRMLKFRTMYLDAESRQKEIEHLNQSAGAAFKMHNDPRITSAGKVLRKLSIDELPQLVNVLRGEMSLVGPRPLPLRDYANFSEDWHRRRFSVRPGISGLWQVSGRSNIAFQQWMELDIKYIDQWSFWLDLNILAKTIPAVLSGQGAY